MFGFERRWLDTIFEAILPSDVPDGIGIGASDVQLSRFTDDFLITAPVDVRVLLRIASWLITLSPPLIGAGFKLFGTLDRDGQTRLLSTLGQSDNFILRELPFVLKTVACMGYGATSEVKRRLGAKTIGSPPDWTLKR